MLLLLPDRRIDLALRVVSQDGAPPVELTQLEAAFLAFLADRPGETVDRDLLLREVWGYAASVHSRAIDKSVHRLRTKIEVDPAEPRHIVGVRGVGYRLDGFRRYAPSRSLEAAVKLLEEAAARAGVEPTRLAANPEERARLARLLHAHAEPLRMIAPWMALQGPGELEAHLMEAIADLEAPPERWLAALRACVDEQWSALDAADREILARLAGFVGSFTSRDALAVQAAEDRARTLDVIERGLVEQLVWVEPGTAGERRMRLAPAVRARALQELDRQGARERVVREAVTRTVVVAEGLVRDRARGDVARALEGLTALLADLEAIIAQTTGWDPTLAARAVLAWAAARGRSHPARLLALLDPLMPEGAPPHPTLGPALLLSRAEALGGLGRPSDAARCCVEALKLTEDPTLHATAMLMLSTHEYWSGQPVESSLRHLEDALATLVGLDEPGLEARMWVALSTQLLRLGEEERALSYICRSIARFRAMRDQELLARTLQHQVNALYNMARFQEALDVSEEVLAEGRGIEGSYFEMRTWLSRFCCFWDLGRVEEAADCAERARLLATSSGRKQPLVLAHCCCGYAAFELGLLDQTRFHFRAARRVAEEAGQSILRDQTSVDLGQEAHWRGALGEARPLYVSYLDAAARAAPLSRRCWGLCLTLLLHLEEGDADALRARADELAGCLSGPKTRRYAYHFDTLALARACLEAPSAEAKAAGLLRYADGMLLEFGHEPRQLAALARRIVDRAGR